jgi:hypothetical protein
VPKIPKSITVQNEAGQVVTFDLTDAKGEDRFIILRQQVIRGDLQVVDPDTEPIDRAPFVDDNPDKRRSAGADVLDAVLEELANAKAEAADADKARLAAVEDAATARNGLEAAKAARDSARSDAEKAQEALAAANKASEVIQASHKASGK